MIMNKDLQKIINFLDKVLILQAKIIADYKIIKKEGQALLQDIKEKLENGSK